MDEIEKVSKEPLNRKVTKKKTNHIRNQSEAEEEKVL
jgi:hypothetical protein